MIAYPNRLSLPNRGLIATLSFIWMVVSQSLYGWVAPPPPFAVSQPSSGPPADVFVGIYLIRIPAISFRDNQWTVDAYVWFRWKGNLDPSPPDGFELCNGSIEKRELTDAKRVKVKNGSTEEEYEFACVRIQAVITNIWDISRYPFDRHALRLLLEDKNRESSRIRYLEDEGASGIDMPARSRVGTLGPCESNRPPMTIRPTMVTRKNRSAWNRLIQGFVSNFPWNGIDAGCMPSKS